MNRFKKSKFTDEKIGQPEETETRRRNLIFLARTAEAAERYDDMCSFMKTIVLDVKKKNDKNDSETPRNDLTVDERNLLSVAYKNVIGARRASWRTLNAESQDEKNTELVKAYKKQVESELKGICGEVLELLNDYLILTDVERENVAKKAEADKSDTERTEKEKEKEKDDAKAAKKAAEAQVFYLKMAGDYYRYLAEARQDKEDESTCSEFYKKAFNLAKIVLEPTHPIRLGLALNYSVCFYEIMNKKSDACSLAKEAFDEAIAKLDTLEENDYKDSTLIMQLLRDNLTLWTSSEAEDSPPKKETGGD